MTSARRGSVQKLVLCAMMAAITAVCAQVAIPIGPVPINLAMLSVFVAGGLLGAGAGAVSQTVYLLVGLLGVPVFSGFSGGPGVVVGPTGGYIVGYIAAAWLTGLLVGHLAVRENGKLRVPVVVLAMAAGLATCYALGTAWFLAVTGAGLWYALTVCVIPFLAGDALKIAVATLLVCRLRPLLAHTGQ